MVIIIMLAFMSYLTAKMLHILIRSSGSVSEELVTKTLQVQTMGGARYTPGSSVLRPGTSSGEGGLGVPTGGAHKMRTSL